MQPGTYTPAGIVQVTLLTHSLYTVESKCSRDSLSNYHVYKFPLIKPPLDTNILKLAAGLERHKCQCLHAANDISRERCL